MQKLINLWMVCCSVIVLASCATAEQKPLVKDTFGDSCATIKVPLPLASKIFDTPSGRQSIHIWRVGVTCRLREIRTEKESHFKVEHLELQLVVKGFAEGAIAEESIEIPIVIWAKDEASALTKARLSEQIEIKLEKDDREVEKTYNYTIHLRENAEDPSKRVYPTIYVAMDLEEKEWRAYKALIEESGERALLPDPS